MELYIKNIIFKMKVRVIGHAQWESTFELFSLKNYFEPFVYYFIL